MRVVLIFSEFFEWNSDISKELHLFFSRKAHCIRPRVNILLRHSEALDATIPFACFAQELPAGDGKRCWCTRIFRVCRNASSFIAVIYRSSLTVHYFVDWLSAVNIPEHFAPHFFKETFLSGGLLKKWKTKVVEHLPLLVTWATLDVHTTGCKIQFRASIQSLLNSDV